MYGYAEVVVQRKKILSRIEGFQARLSDMNRQRTIMSQQMVNMEGELRLNADQREEMIKKQEELVKSELGIIAEKGKAGYNDIVIQKIQENLKRMHNETYELDKKLNAVNGALEDSQYFLKQLNA